MTRKKITASQGTINYSEKASEHSPADLARQNELLNGLLDSITDIMFCKDAAGCYLSCNKAFAEHLGLNKDEIVGRTDFDLYPLEQAAFYRRNDQIVLEQNERRCNEEWISYPDGRRILIETCKTPYYGHDGKFLGLIGVSRDITERKKIEEQSRQIRTHELKKTIQELQQEINEREKSEKALRESEAKYRLLVDNSYDLIWTLNAQGVFTYVSPSWLRMLGYEPSSVTGTKFHLFIHPDDVTLCEKSLNEVISPQRRMLMPEFRVKHANGDWRWHAATTTPIFDSDGSFVYLVGISRDVTERKQMEEELLWKEAFLEAQAEATLDGILVVDNKSQKILLNQHLLDMWHVPQHIRDDKDDTTLLQYVTSITRYPDKFSAKVMYLYDHPDETSRDEIEFTDGMVLDRYSSPVLGKDGKYYGRIWRFSDITERKQAVEELKESQQKLSNIIDFLPDATFVIDKEGKVIAWNRAIEEMTGIRAVDMLDKGNYEYALPFYGERRPILIDLVLEPREDIEAGYIRTDRGNLFLEAEANISDLRGSEVYLYGKASILRDSKGNIVGAIESIRDITARRRAEGKYRAIFENAVMGIYQATPEGRIISANPAFASILGFESPEDVVATLTNIRQQLYVNPEQRSVMLQLMNEHGAVKEMEINIFRKDGSTAWIVFNGRALRDNSGKVIYYEGAIRDITENKALESQLRQAQKMEAIGTLAGGIAHDFNNILSAVIGYAEMAIREPGVSDRLRLYLKQIYKAGTLAGELVKQILTFSRQSDEKLHPLRISPIVKEVMKLLRASLPTTIEIRQKIQSSPDMVLANPTQIHQVLMNLCTNSAHSIGTSKGILEVSLATVAIKHNDVLIRDGLIPGIYIKLTVGDSGQGIAPEIMSKIFDPFFTTKKPGEGTGMGLAVVYGIVKRCGGTITVRSEEGKGAEFNVYYPLLAEPEEKKQKDDAVHIVGGGERILFVDDEEVLVELGKEILSSLGYKVVGRTSSRDALKLFRSCPQKFDLVITDMTMPNMTGLDLAKELKLIRPDIPVILCTGFSELITQESLQSLGLRELIMKPIILKQLDAAIRRELDRKEKLK